MSMATSRRTLSVGPWIKLPTLASLEAVRAAAPDFVCIDMCNGWLSIEKVAELAAVRGDGVRTLVRLSAGATSDVAGQLLDAGAQGLVFAHVSSPLQALEWVAATRFAPIGTRGMGSTGRAGNWGLGTREQYLGTSGQQSAVVPTVAIMIEDARAVTAVTDIAAVAGVDQLVVGSADLALAFPDQLRYRQAIDAVAAACRQQGISAGIAVGSAEQVAGLADRGFDSFYLSNDLTLLARAAQREFRLARA